MKVYIIDMYELYYLTKEDESLSLLLKEALLTPNLFAMIRR